MKIQKLSILLAGIGLFIIFIFTWKFMIHYEFTSMWLVGCGIGAGFLIASYIYSWIKQIDRSIEEINDRIDSFQKWLSKEEWK